MTNTLSIRNLKALCEQEQNRDASLLVPEHLGDAQVLGREIAELVRAHTKYLGLVGQLRNHISLSAQTIRTQNDSVAESNRQRTRIALFATFKELETSLNEMQGHLSTVAVGINALRG